MMEIKIIDFNEQVAREVCTWRYLGEYAIYNFSDYDEAVKKGYTITDEEIRNKEFLAFSLNDELIAFGRLSEENDFVTLGIGLKPNLCGQGLGQNVMQLLINESHKHYPNKPITLEVRTFNERAKKCYEKVGFEVKEIIHKDMGERSGDFYYMELI